MLMRETNTFAASEEKSYFDRLFNVIDKDQVSLLILPRCVRLRN